MALTQISTDGIKNGTITGTDLATSVDLVDDQKIRFGTGDDLEIYHSGTHSYIQNTTNFLFIHSNSLALRSQSQETFIDCSLNGSVDLYYDNTKKFETTSDGVHVLGTLEGDNLKASNPGNNALLIQNPSNGIIGFGANNQTNQVTISTDGHLGIPSDSGRLRLGASEDLQIYHSGSVSFIDDLTSGSDGVSLRGKNIRLQTNAHIGAETALNALANGAVELYYDNTKKFETTSAGATVTGDITATGNLSITSAAPQIFLTDSNADSDFAIVVNTGQFRIRDETNSANRLAVNSDGHVDIYGRLDVEGGIQIPADNAKIELGASQDLEIYHDGSNSYIDENGTGNLRIRNVNGNGIELISGTGELNLKANYNGSVELYYDNSKKFETTSSGGTLYGDWLADASFLLADNDRIKLGNGADLQIYHNGTNNIIAGFTASDINIESYFNADVNIITNSNHYAIACISNAQVELYYDNSKKLETTSSGIDVTGAITVNGSALTTATNSPAFSVKLSSTTNRNGEGTVVFDSEHLDTDSCYDTSNGRFTPDVAGNYMFTFTFVMNGSSSGIIAGAFGAIRKNGSTIIARFWTDPMQSNNNQLNRASCSGSAIIPMNGSSDYVEIRAYGLTTTGGNVRISDDGSNFSGFKLA